MLIIRIVMSEAEPNQNPSQDPLRQTRPSDASFFVGREGLRLPSALLKLPDSSLPVQPVTDLFDTVSHVWDLNGYQTGRQPRYEVIELSPRGYNLHALLFSSYIGKSDEELANVEPLLDRSGTRLRQTQHGETIQGVENFAISIPPDIARTGKPPKLSSGRVSLLLSRTYHFASELVQDLHPTDDGANQP